LRFGVGLCNDQMLMRALSEDALGDSRSLKPTDSLLGPFFNQSATIRSIVAVECRELWQPNEIDGLAESVLVQLVAEDSAVIEGESTLDRLARQARERSSHISGYDLLVLPAGALREMMTPPDRDFGFRAVAVLLTDISGEPDIPGGLDPGDWRLQRSLFDRGLICVGLAALAGCKALCFLASYAVRSFNCLHAESRGHITMSGFLQAAAFGNYLFRYACVKLYALRHGLTPGVPAWEGNRLFGLEDRPWEGPRFPVLSYPGFAQNDREIWEPDEPRINIDLIGYFQEIPACWRSHRSLLRHLFQLSPVHLEAIGAWRYAVTQGGRRTLVAVHVRRGNYIDLPGIPFFRLVPVDWYLDWLRAVWPTLCDPILFVGTDAPAEILPKFREFEMVSATFGQADEELPDYVRDFEVLRRADYLAMCNSSFSRMAAILAPPNQRCFLPSFAAQSFAPYEPWIDPGFWQRFASEDP